MIASVVYAYVTLKKVSSSTKNIQELAPTNKSKTIVCPENFPKPVLDFRVMHFLHAFIVGFDKERIGVSTYLTTESRDNSSVFRLCTRVLIFCLPWQNTDFPVGISGGANITPYTS